MLPWLQQALQSLMHLTIRPMNCRSVRPTAMLLFAPPSRLAYRLHRQGGLFLRALAAVSGEQPHPKQPLPAAAAEPPAAAARAAHSQQLQQQQQQLSIVAANPESTELLAHFFACELRPADCYLLYGSVGAGKSYFSRSFIRAAADDDELPVPSPTFLLQNIYTDHAGPAIHHFDLYRLTQRYDLARLDLPASFSQAVCLVEWAERLALRPEHVPQDHLAVHISILEAAEQQRLAGQLAQQQQGRQQQQAEQQQDSLAGGALDGSGREQDEEQGLEGSGDDCSGDLRWRRIQVAPAGSASPAGTSRWDQRLRLLRRYLQAEGPQLGCFLLEGPEGGQG